MTRPYQRQPVNKIADKLTGPISREMDRTLQNHQETLDTIAPSGSLGAHATSHQNGGSDEINVAGLSGVLADPQTAIAHALLDGSRHSDTSADAVSRGSLIVGNSTPAWDELVVGAANTVLRSDGTDAAWSALVALLDRVQTFSRAQSIAPGANTEVALNITGDNSGASDMVRITTGSGSGSLLAFTVDAVGFFNCGGFTIWTNGVGLGGSFGLGIDPSPVTADRTINAPNVSGRWLIAATSPATVLTLTKGVVVGTDPPAVAAGDLGKVDLTAQSADIAATNLSNTPPSLVYRVSVELMCTTADVTAGTLAVLIGWTDAAGATTQAPVGGLGTLAAFSLAATGRAWGSVFFRRSSTEITYSVTNSTGTYNNARYAIYLRTECLG